MLIDQFLPNHDVASRHSAEMRASVEDAYAAVLRCDLRSSWLSRALFELRSLSRRGFSGPVLDHMNKLGLIHLAEDPPREIVMGLVGRFSAVRGGLQRVDPGSFASFSQPGLAKAVWTFTVTPAIDGNVKVTTETRVLCGDAASKRKFKLYWTAIGPFSGLIRREMLKEIKQRASAPG